MKIFLYSCSVYSCYLFLISSASVRSIPFLSFIVPIFFMKCSLDISNFLEEISSLSHSIAFLYFFHWSLRKAFLSLLAILWKCAFRCVYLSFSPLPFTCLLFPAICKPYQTTILPFCISFSWGGFGSPPPVQCYEPPSIILWALCLSDLIPWIYLSLLLYNHKGLWFRSYVNGLMVFPTFFKLGLNFAIRSSRSDHNQFLVLFLLTV